MSKPMVSPFDSLMSMLPSVLSSLPGEGSKADQWDGGTWLQSNMNCLAVSPASVEQNTCWEGKPMGDETQSKSYPCFFGLRYNRGMVSDPALATPQLPIFPGFSSSMGSFLNVYPSDQSYDPTLAM